MGRGFTWKQVTIASLCNSGLEWIYQGVCRYIQFKAILLEMLSCLPKVVISYFWISKGMLLRPVSLDSNVFLWHSHMFELLSWFRSAQLEAFLWIYLPPPCLPLLVKPHLHLLQHLKARDSNVVFIFRWSLLWFWPTIFRLSTLSCYKESWHLCKNDKN